MKKAASTVFAALLLVFSLTFTSEAYEAVKYDEISFIIDDNCTLMLDDATGTAWLSEDEKTEVKFSAYQNLDAIDFEYCSYDEAEMFYFNNSDAEELEILYANSRLLNYSQGVELGGTKVSFGEKKPFVVFLVSTESYVYCFEFLIYDGEATDYNEFIEGIISSIELTPDEAPIEYYSDDDFLTVVPAVISFVVIFGLFSIIKGFNGKAKGTVMVDVEEFFDGFSEITDKLKASKLKITVPKFELNGKKVNAFNKKYTVGSNDNNFAQKELERERKERQNMFK